VREPLSPSGSLSATEPKAYRSGRQRVVELAHLAALRRDHLAVELGPRPASAGHVPAPISELVIKLYADRGDEPGVGHGQATIPDVTRSEAELILNLAGAVGNYLKTAIQVDEPS
jgi:hypothetical protein